MASTIRRRASAPVDLFYEGLPHHFVCDAASPEDVARPCQVQKIGFSASDAAFDVFALLVGQGSYARVAWHWP
jgi:hypothetical protein